MNSAASRQYPLGRRFAPAVGRASLLALAGTSPFVRVVGLLERIDRSRRPLLPVLMYHRIAEAADEPLLDPSLISASPGEFERQMTYLAAARRVLSLEELLAVRRGRMELPRGAVLVTFDDGYRDFAEHAWPVLERLGVPVTLFVPTALPDTPGAAFWWDHLHAALARSPRQSVASPVGRLPLRDAGQRDHAHRVLCDWLKRASHGDAMAAFDGLATELGVPGVPSPVLGWRELRELAEAGVALAPHTRTHPLLDRLPIEAAREEVLGSITDLRREVGTAPPVFAFPAGGHTDELASWLPEAGVEVAFTTKRGSNDLRAPDWLRLRRINVGRRSPLPLVRAQLLSWSAGPGRRPLAAAS
jgi:peptidoglycan/xylan/chitin deacetylase (PgdA/CDA1 family)